MKNYTIYFSHKTLFVMCLLWCIGWTSQVYAKKSGDVKTDANVIGHVVDKKTREHLSHIIVMLSGTVVYTTTDATGHYMLKDLPVGKTVLEVRATGYRIAQKEVMIEKGKTHEVNFEVEEDQIALDEVVVSANRNVMLRREAPNLVHVLDNKLFDATHSTNLAQGLNFQPGVRTEDNCSNCGFTQVRINGLEGHYSQILIDSRPVFSALQGVYGLEQIPANMIERVEVVRGGGSALAGASAIGGTINIITKEPKGNSAEVGHSITSMGSNVFENVTSVNGSLISDNHKAGFYVYGQSKHRSGYDRNGDGYTDLPQLKSQTLGVNTFLRLTDYSRLLFKYHGIKEFRRGGNNLHLPPHESNIAEQLDHNIQGGSLSYDLYSPTDKNKLNAYFSFQSIERKSYYGGMGDGSQENIADALKAYANTRNLTVLTGLQYTHRFEHLLFMPSQLMAGMEYNFDRIKDHSLGFDYLMKQYVRIGSAYLQNEWKNDHWGFLVGGRLDKHSMINRVIFSPRLNLRYNPTSDLHFRLTYASGFRAPQAFDEDLHTTMAGGERVKVQLSRDLKEERSHSLSASADYYHTFGRVPTNFLVEAFFTQLHDVFAQRKLNQTDALGNTISERFNAHRASVMGLNLEAKAVFTSHFSLQTGLTWQKSSYAEPIVWDEDATPEKRMLRTPNLYGYFTANLTPLKNFTLSLSGNYTGSMLVGHAATAVRDYALAVETPSFFTLNLKASYDLTLYNHIKVQINGGVQNIGDAYQKDIDTGWQRDAGYIYGPSIPRSLFAGVKIMF